MNSEIVQVPLAEVRARARPMARGPDLERTLYSHTLHQAVKAALRSSMRLQPNLRFGGGVVILGSGGFTFASESHPGAVYGR